MMYTVLFEDVFWIIIMYDIVLHGYPYPGVGYTYRVLGYGNGTYPDVPSRTMNSVAVPGTS